MRQIPQKGEYCGECPCRNANVCLLYVEQLSFDIQALRDTQCLRDKPQVMTEEERAALYEDGRVKGMANVEGYHDYTLRGTIKKWQVDPESL